MSRTLELQRDGLVLRAQARGPADGELVVLQHGRGGDATTWDAVAAHIVGSGRSRRVIAPDLRGHGASDWGPPERYTVDVLAEDLAAWITGQGSSCALVGHSYGAAVALATAARHPELVSSLLLEDGGPAGRVLMERWGRAGSRPMPATRFASTAEAEAELERLYPGDTTPANRDQRLASFFRPDTDDGGLVWRCDMPGMAAAPRDELLLEGSWDLLDRIRCPLTLVVAGRDSMLDPDVGPRVLARLPDARVTVVDGAGHRIHSDRPAEYLRLIDDFLAADPSEVPA